MHYGKFVCLLSTKGCQLSHFNNITVNIIDFKINTHSTYMQLFYVLNILLQFVGWEISSLHHKMVSTWRGWWKQWGRTFQFINWVFWNQLQWIKSIWPHLITATFHQLLSKGWMTIQLVALVHFSISPNKVFDLNNPKVTPSSPNSKSSKSLIFTNSLFTNKHPYHCFKWSMYK